jgi:hypothetical protein
MWLTTTPRSSSPKWFEDRWNDKWCVDISAELVQVIEQSWAREVALPPYYIYVKMAYHLAQEARAGLSEFRIPPEFGNRLFDYQVAAVKIAAHHLNKRNGVLIGDVVGLGKTLMATALAKIFQDDHFTETLIICPKNLVKMWEDYVSEYRLLAKVMSVTKAIRELPELRRYRVVLIDESHNLRNRSGKKYRAIQEYIQENESKCILLSATPYNKTYLDLSNQLRLFVAEDKDLGIRPERLLRDIGETEFLRRHQCPVRSLAAFEKSEYTDDWRELMRLYMVRRTRSFIQDNYATLDPATGRKFLTFEDGSRSYFPERVPKTVTFKIDEQNSNDQYARLYAPDMVAAINALNLPRYGLANYVAATPHKSPTPAEAKQLQDLSRAGKRLMGFCRTNLFKRLESSGEAFQQSIERHILRNHIFLHAIENNLPLPLGTQDSGLLDMGNYDEDVDEARAGQTCRLPRTHVSQVANRRCTDPETGSHRLHARRGGNTCAGRCDAPRPRPDHEWYASVMLNRLMFVYFIQRKGFLDGDRDYLRNRLNRCQQEKGKDKFYSFYRYFLLRLFHEGFGKRRRNARRTWKNSSVNIPYLNGGLFDVHDIEKRYGEDIQIPDKAFERIFDYFDQYQWHLDERPLRADNEINPDVLGYIFEKYINQKQMGAYYTKEDITEYISKNTVLPFLFDAARPNAKSPLKIPTARPFGICSAKIPTATSTTRSKRASKFRCRKSMPDIKTCPSAHGWNKSAPGEFALPTEIWREVVARRQRYEEIEETCQSAKSRTSTTSSRSISTSASSRRT